MDRSPTSSSSPALVIGLVYGAVGLLSGFCLMSSLRGWWAEGDGRLVRTYALAMGVAIAASQLLAAAGLVDLGKSIYLQPSFSAPVLFLGGLLFGYGMVMSNGCGSRALVLLGRGNLRSLVVVIVLAHLRADDAEGPDRAGAHRAWSVRRKPRPTRIRCRRCWRRSASAQRRARMLAASDRSRGADHLCFCARAVPAVAGPDRGRSHRRPSGRRRLVCHRLSRRR